MTTVSVRLSQILRQKYDYLVSNEELRFVQSPAGTQTGKKGKVADELYVFKIFINNGRKCYVLLSGVWLLA
ncbi:hypothetical protein [Desulfopila inferna]|uniref:hypothetical protein n=1 Tax=Desulfopila inferna TaxID=468528 RepID=UPI00196647F5|nr:hypothetical protein [Desulfopila inferna]MBM9604388.1 hypothetical protein [Desulfopila inferna]